MFEARLAFLGAVIDAPNTEERSLSQQITILIEPFGPFVIDSLQHADSDSAFTQLYQSYFKGTGQSENDFSEAAMSYFDETDGHMTAVDRYFFNFTPLWMFHIVPDRYNNR